MPGDDLAVWKDYEGGGSFKIAPSDNDLYQAALYGARITLEVVERTLADAEEYKLQCRIIGRYLLIDWKDGIVSANGNEVSYSPAWAENLLKSNPGFFAWVVRESTKIANKEA